MQRLNRQMLNRYDIPERTPAALNAVQFGTNEALLGTADLLIDAAGGVGVACLRPEVAPAEGVDSAALLREQDGLYTVLLRGYRAEQPVREERVVQLMLRVEDAKSGPEVLGAMPSLALALVDTCSDDMEAELSLAARLLAARRAAGLDGLSFICLGEDAGCALRTRDAIAALADGDAGLVHWLKTSNAFYPALAEGVALRAEAHEAAKLCEAMNYADGMIHLADPAPRLTVQAPEAFRQRWPLDRAGGIRFVDDLSDALAQKHRFFDAGLFATVAPGWLLGLDTLSDCMRHERLRAFVGHAYNEEIIPPGEAPRRAAAPRVVEAFERFENPLNRNALLRAGHHLLRRFERGALPLMRAWAEENFEPPRRLSFALAATIMLYAGARQNAKGRYEVLRGSQVHALIDDPRALAVFSSLSHDMPPEALAYAALADRELWHGEDLRQIDGLEARVALDIAQLQRRPGYLPEDAQV
ncbi:MAG: hypothetical protein IJ124_07230 [Clostridia bacterium]|nr:hypothetical protein [Clostridia bacterium]